MCAVGGGGVGGTLGLIHFINKCHKTFIQPMRKHTDAGIAVQCLRHNKRCQGQTSLNYDIRSERRRLEVMGSKGINDILSHLEDPFVFSDGI